MGHLCDPRAFNTEGGGNIPASIEIKLIDFPEAGYFSTNKPSPQGEIWIRGDPVMERYYDNPTATAEAIAPGGWFMTGDIGEIDQKGLLKVIDRKKNLVKTLNGEYIALEKVYLHFHLFLSQAHELTIIAGIYLSFCNCCSKYLCLCIYPRNKPSCDYHVS